MQRLASVTFTWNPDKTTLPQAEKFVSSVPTYSSSAIFQWTEQWVGKRITLEWDYMQVAQYNQLYSLYLNQALQEWNPDNRGESFYVIVVSLTGELFETGLFEQPYRENVQMVLEIRSKASTTSTTT